jgi:hypothetical protein
MNLELLIAQIELAFSDVPYPGEHDLSASTYGEEPDALRREFKGKTHWREVEAKFLDQAPDGWRSALSFFSDRAFVFYLPAYLIADIRNQLLEVSVDFHLCYGLTGKSANEKIAKIWGGGAIGENARRKYAQFNPPQVAAIVGYLRLKLEQTQGADIAQALEQYWLRR